MPENPLQARSLAALRAYQACGMSLPALALYRALLLSSASCAQADYDALPPYSQERLAVLARGRVSLIRCGGLSVPDWLILPPWSPERAAVIIDGAAVLGEKTTWTGWDQAARATAGASGEDSPRAGKPGTPGRCTRTAARR